MFRNAPSCASHAASSADSAPPPARRPRSRPPSVPASPGAFPPPPPPSPAPATQPYTCGETTCLGADAPQLARRTDRRERVRGEGRGVSTWYEGRDETCPVSTGKGGGGGGDGRERGPRGAAPPGWPRRGTRGAPSGGSLAARDPAVRRQRSAMLHQTGLDAAVPRLDALAQSPDVFLASCSPRQPAPTPQLPVAAVHRSGGQHGSRAGAGSSTDGRRASVEVSMRRPKLFFCQDERPGLLAARRLSQVPCAGGTRHLGGRARHEGRQQPHIPSPIRAG